MSSRRRQKQSKKSSKQHGAASKSEEGNNNNAGPYEFQKTQRECRNPNCPNTDSNEEEPNMVCSRCKQACYCSRECQKAHWKKHKEECDQCVNNGARLAGKSDQPTLLSGGGKWVLEYDDDDRKLMEEWKRSMPRSTIPKGSSVDEAMRMLGVTPEFVEGIPTGDWFQLMRKLQIVDRNVNYKNRSPLRPGDYVEVVAGNSVKWSAVGQRGTLMEYFADDGKWGIEMENDDPSLIKAGNLKRIER